MLKFLKKLFAPKNSVEVVRFHRVDFGYKATDDLSQRFQHCFELCQSTLWEAFPNIREAESFYLVFSEKETAATTHLILHQNCNGDIQFKNLLTGISDYAYTTEPFAERVKQQLKLGRVFVHAETIW